MDERIDLSIVIVNFNTVNYTLQCLGSIREHPPSVPYEIIVVDNASSDNSVEVLTMEYPEISVIRSDKNLGIAGGNNLGIRSSSGRYILLLNNDTIVLPGTLDQVVNYLESNPEVGGVGGELINPDRSFQSGYMDFPFLLQEFLIFTKIGALIRPYYPSHAPVSDEREVDWMSTAFMAFRKDALDNVGLVDEEYFIYCDETDLQYRLRKAGWRIVHTPEVKTIHYGGKSLTPWRRRIMVYRGYLLFFHKHYGSFQTGVLRLFFSVICSIKLITWAVIYFIPGKQARARHELSSNIDILSMCFRPGVIPPSM